MTFFPFVLIRKREFENDKVLVNHERIHLQQQIELLVLPFYVLYLLNYFFNLIRFFNHNKAYHEIVFEKEAFKFEMHLSYLEKRRWFAFLYLSNY